MNIITKHHKIDWWFMFVSIPFVMIGVCLIVGSLPQATPIDITMLLLGVIFVLASLSVAFIIGTSKQEAKE